MNIKSSICGIQHACIKFFNFPYNYKNRVLACFQTRPAFFHCSERVKVISMKHVMQKTLHDISPPHADYVTAIHGMKFYLMRTDGSIIMGNRGN